MIAFALTLAAGGPLTAADNARAKMIVMRGGEGVAITDYPSLARCEAAKATLDAMVQRYNHSHSSQTLPNGGVIVTMPYIISAVCLPG